MLIDNLLCKILCWEFYINKIAEFSVNLYLVNNINWLLLKDEQCRSEVSIMAG